jgi:hypothetical protein
MQSDVPLPARASLTVLERPVLRLGLIGFEAHQREAVRQVLRARVANPAPRASVAWELADREEADAWWVHGPAARAVGDGSVEVRVDGSGSIRFYPAEVGRPLAWSLPVTGAISAQVLFEADSAGSVEATLLRFEQALQPLTVQLCLASQLLQLEAELGSRIYHVHAKGRMLAVVDLRGDTAVRPTATLHELAGAHWSARPAPAAVFPEDFVRSSLSLLMWQYASRTHEDLLPHRYRLGPIYLRRAPRLPQQLLRDRHLLLLRQLAARPRTFVELQEETGLGAPVLAHELAALYLVGAITANPRRARTLGEAALACGAPSVSPSGLGAVESLPAAQVAASTSPRALTQ